MNPGGPEEEMSEGARAGWVCAAGDRGRPRAGSELLYIRLSLGLNGVQSPGLSKERAATEEDPYESVDASDPDGDRATAVVDVSFEHTCGEAHWMIAWNLIKEGGE